jgi:putative ABC transport system permease protein
MFRNFFLTSLRNLWRHKSYTLINILGLAIGIASSVIILLFVQDELSYDRHNEKFDQIYRFYIKGNIQGNEVQAALSCAPLGPTLKSDFPEVLEYTRVYTFSGDPIVRYEDKVFIEKSFLYADSTFFNVFTAPATRGDPRQMLNRPNTVVLTEETAKKYFGEDDPIGKILKVGQEETPYEVTGVVKEFPANSHLHFNLLGSFASTWLADMTMWLGNNNYTYIVLQTEYPPEQLEAKIPSLLEQYMGPQIEQILGMTLEHFYEGGNEYGYLIQSLKDIHLRSDLQFEIEPGGSITTVYIFSLIAIFLILIASINFMNLATASSSSRAPEVGIRKVVGSDRGKLVWKFMTESFIITLIALLLAILLVELFIPSFNNLSHKALDFNVLKNPVLLPALILIGIFVGFLSGSYPAFFLSTFKPVSVLKGKLREGMRSSYLRSILVTLQFTITICLFISTFVVYKQMNYIQAKDLGFEKENVLIIDRAYVLGEQSEVFRQELLKNPDILFASYSNSVPGGLIGDNAWVPEGASTDETHAINNIYADPYFASAYNLEITDGRWFSETNPTDSFAIVVNEATVKAFGFDDPLSKRLMNDFGDNVNPLQIIGVVKDFHFQSLHQEVKPLILIFLNFNSYTMSVKISGNNVEKTLAYIETTWNTFVAEQPINMTFLEDDLSTHYSSEKSVGIIFSIFSILAIFIAALGLLGLASYSAEQRTKEVGIRKVMGARITQVMSILSKEIVWLILFATIIAWPVSYFFMKDWLQNFAFRIKLDPLVFVVSTLLAFLIAILTVSIRTYRAAVVNPAESLRYE